MRLKYDYLLSSAMCRVAAVGLLAGALGACSTDVARFSGNPFSNPFKGGASSAVDRSSTGTIKRQATQVQQNVSTAPSLGTVSSQPLAAPVANALPSRTSLAQRAPSAVDLASTGSVTPRSVAGWSATGGTPVVMAAGENVNTLAMRYGVPASAILATNGVSNASQLTPGSRVTIPAFNAGGASSPRAQVPEPVAAPAAPAVPVPVTPRPPQPVASMSQRGEQVRAVAKPAVSPARENETTRLIPPAPVAAPKAVASASADAARERAKSQAEAAKARAEATKTQTAASSRADVEVAARKAAEAKAKAEAERARLAEARAKTAEERAKAAETTKEADAKRIKAAEAKKKTEADRKVQADAKAKADREAQAARVAATTTPSRLPVDPAPTSSVPKDEPRAAAADFRWPARGRVISGFSGKGANEGINIAVPEGTPVKAAGDGVVAYSGNELKGYGNLVLIRHENGYVSAYAHNGDVNVKRGERVSRGQTIAKSGQSGNVSSPQLHFEIRKGSTPVDPMPYLAN